MSKQKRPVVIVDWKKLLPIIIGLGVGAVVIILIKIL